MNINPEVLILFDKFRNAPLSDGGLEGKSWDQVVSELKARTLTIDHISNNFVIRFLPRHGSLQQRTRDRANLQQLLRAFLQEKLEANEPHDGFVIKDSPSRRR